MAQLCGFSHGLFAPTQDRGKQSCFTIHDPDQKESLGEAPRLLAQRGLQRGEIKRDNVTT